MGAMMRASDPRTPLPNRIWIVGPAGSGKSTLAKRLGRALRLPVAMIDELHWLPNWESRPDAELHASIENVARLPAWVIEGNYRRFRARQRHRIDLLIWLDLPLVYVLMRLLRRSLRRSLRGESCCNGNRESLRRLFLHRDSVVLYMLSTWSSHRRAYRQDAARLSHLRLRSARDVERFVQSIAARAGHEGAA